MPEFKKGMSRDYWKNADDKPYLQNHLECDEFEVPAHWLDFKKSAYDESLRRVREHLTEKGCGETVTLNDGVFIVLCDKVYRLKGLNDAPKYPGDEVVSGGRVHVLVELKVPAKGSSTK